MLLAVDGVSTTHRRRLLEPWKAWAVFLGVAVPVAVVVYAYAVMNLGARFYNGCMGLEEGHGLTLVDTEPRFSWLPPHYFCLYRTKSGKLVQRDS